MKRRSPGMAPRRVGRPHRRLRPIWLCATLLALLAVGAPAQAENTFGERGGQAFDLVVVRPLGVGRVLVGFALFVPAGLVAGNSASEAWDLFVVEPFRATFMTPLGEFEEEY